MKRPNLPRSASGGKPTPGKAAQRPAAPAKSKGIFAALNRRDKDSTTQKPSSKSGRTRLTDTSATANHTKSTAAPRAKATSTKPTTSPENHRDRTSPRTANPTSPRTANPTSPRTDPKRVAAQPSTTTALGRILTLLVVAATVFLVIFSPLRSWMQQQEEARQLAQRVAEAKETNQRLEDEIKRYEDPEYIAQEARERLGYVKPGEVTYVVVDAPGEDDKAQNGGWAKEKPEDKAWFALLAEGVRVADARTGAGSGAGSGEGGSSSTGEGRETPKTSQ